MIRTTNVNFGRHLRSLIKMVTAWFRIRKWHMLWPILVAKPDLIWDSVDNKRDFDGWRHWGNSQGKGFGGWWRNQLFGISWPWYFTDPQGFQRYDTKNVEFKEVGIRHSSTRGTFHNAPWGKSPSMFGETWNLSYQTGDHYSSTVGTKLLLPSVTYISCTITR